MDKIILPEISVMACHGWEPEEKTIPQPFCIRLTLHLDLRPAGTRDSLEDTVDYGRLYCRVKQFAESSSFGLIEALAEHIAALALEDEKVSRADVIVEKRQAMAGGEIFPALVCLERSR